MQAMLVELLDYSGRSVSRAPSFGRYGRTDGRKSLLAR